MSSYELASWLPEQALRCECACAPIVAALIVALQRMDLDTERLYVGDPDLRELIEAFRVRREKLQKEEAILTPAKRAELDNRLAEIRRALKEKREVVAKVAKVAELEAVV